jgi:hypothetical protein
MYLLKNVGLPLLFDDSACCPFLLQLLRRFRIGLVFFVIVEPLPIFLPMVTVMQYDLMSQQEHLPLSVVSRALFPSLEPGV